MNPMNRQHAIREYELFVSGGVQEVPETVFERDQRAAGEYREVRAQQPQPLIPGKAYAGIDLGEITIDLETGEIIEPNR